MHLLDSDTLTHLHAGHPRVVQRLQALTDPDVGITIITRIELLQGRFDFLLRAATAADLQRAQGLLHRTEELLAPLVVLPITEAAANQFEVLRTTRGLRRIGRADLLIASIVLAHQATLVTRNVRHFHQIRDTRHETRDNALIACLVSRVSCLLSGVWCLVSGVSCLLGWWTWTATRGAGSGSGQRR